MIYVNTYEDGSGGLQLYRADENIVKRGETQVYASFVAEAEAWGMPLWVTTIPLKGEDPALGLFNWWW